MSIILPNLNHSFISPVPVPVLVPVPVPVLDFRVFHTPCTKWQEIEVSKLSARKQYRQINP